MPREPPATLLCLSMTIGARQGRNFSLNFSSCITVDKVQLQSLDQHSLGTRREHVDLLPHLVGLQAQQCRGNNCVFFYWLHWSMLAAAGTAGKREQSLFGKGHCSKWQKLLKKLLLNAWATCP